MSVWTSVQDFFEPFPHRPQLFECQLRHFKWWHCGEYHTLDFATVRGCFFHFWWSEIFPSFQEFSRKVATGTTACGFGLKAGKKNPIAILWGDSNAVGRMNKAAGIIGPVQTVFFVWWATSAVMEAGAMAQTMMYVEDVRDWEPNSIIVPANAIVIPAESGTYGVPLPEALCEFTLSHPANANFIQAPEPGYWSSHIWGSVAANANSWSSVKARFQSQNQDYGEIDFGPLAAGETLRWDVQISNQLAGERLAHELEMEHSGTALPPLTVVSVDRWVAEWSPVPLIDKPCNPGLALRSLSEAQGIA